MKERAGCNAVERKCGLEPPKALNHRAAVSRGEMTVNAMQATGSGETEWQKEQRSTSNSGQLTFSGMVPAVAGLEVPSDPVSITSFCSSHLYESPDRSLEVGRMRRKGEWWRSVCAIVVL